MGRTIEIAPPILTHAAIFSFFFRVERDPGVTVDPTGGHVMNGPAGLLQNIGAGGVSTRKPAKTSRPLLESRIHDQDFSRLVSCVDPYSSKGLPALYCKGQIEGSWEGRFSFFDFDSYRDMLGGRMRSLYEGPFGDQPQVWKLEERIIKLERGQKRGGTGPILNAGFELGQSGPRPSFSTSHSSTSTGSAFNPERSPSNTRKSVELDDDILDSAASRSTKRARSFESNPWDDLEMLEEEDDQEQEILLTGSVRSRFLSSY